MIANLTGGNGAGWPVTIGQRKLFNCYGTGPASYSQTTRDALSLPAGTYFDFISSGMLSVSGTYYVRALPSAGNTLRGSWKFAWYVTATGAEVANAVNLSGETVVFLATGGDF